MAPTISRFAMPLALLLVGCGGAQKLADSVDLAVQIDLGVDVAVDLTGAPPFDLTGAPPFDLTGAPPPDLLDPIVLATSFAMTPAAAWPSPWHELGGVGLADVDQGRGRFHPTLTSYSLARMGAPLGIVNSEAVYKIRFAEPTTSGIGFYLRSNGGHLQTTATHGQGYAVFVEGFRGNFIGVWREVDGVESEIEHVTLPFALAANTDYWVRFVVAQETSTTTRLAARIWAASGSEPSTWNLDRTHDEAILQNLAGDAAFDCWSNYQTAGPAPHDCFVDDLTIRALP